jgi:hypothetical protein
MDTSGNQHKGPYNLNRSNGVYISYMGDTLDQIFSTKIEKQPFYAESREKFEKLGWPWENKLLLRFDEDGQPIYLDNVNTYMYNSDGFRSAEFDGSADLLYAGCSTTFGTGVPEEAIWGSMVADTLGVKRANISRQGTSASWIVKNIFAYFDTYGHPKTVCCLFPDLYRTTIATNPSQLTYQAHGNEASSVPKQSFTKVYDVHLDQVLPPNLALDYSKKPHDMLNILPADVAVYNSIQSILMLDQYCRSHGITFLWSTWDVNSFGFLSRMKTIYPKNYSNYIEIDLEWWIPNTDSSISGEIFVGEQSGSVRGKSREAINCHQDLLEKYGVNFYRGRDEAHGIEYTHPGIHQHAHIAEKFLQRLSD